MAELAAVLRRERRLLDVLLFKMIELRCLLTTGETRFLPWAVSEVERAVEQVREIELVRATAVHKLARELDVPEDALTLGRLATDSAEPWRTIFSEARRGLFEVVAEIEEVGQANRKLAGTGMHGVSEVLTTLFGNERRTDDAGLYGPAGAALRPQPVSTRFDGAL